LADFSVHLTDYQDWDTFLSDNQDEEECHMDDLELSEDIYCLTFAMLMKSRNVIVHRELVLKSGIAFMVQILLTMIVWRSSADFDKVAVAEKFVNTARIIASFLLHFTMVPEIKTALRMT
jgi:hypothetical protein